MDQKRSRSRANQEPGASREHVAKMAELYRKEKETGGREAEVGGGMPAGRSHGYRVRLGPDFFGT